MKKKGSRDLVSNRKAFHDYEIEETYEAGLVLKGTEIKSLRQYQGSLQEAYVKFIKDELWLIGAHIPPYSQGNVHNHEEYRDRKLLMNRYELRKLRLATQEKGRALIPLALYLSKGKAKLKLGRGVGKKMYDKRHSIKEKDVKRRMDQAMKKF